MAGKKGRSGRPRKSARGHLLDGTNRFDRHGNLAARASADELRNRKQRPVAPPRWLEPEAKQHWRWLMRALQRDPRFDVVLDRGLVADVCRAHARRVAAEKIIAAAAKANPETLGIVAEGRDGQPIKHPAVEISRAAAEQRRRLEAELELRLRQRGPAVKERSAETSGGPRGPKVTDRLGRPV